MALDLTEKDSSFLTYGTENPADYFKSAEQRVAEEEQADIDAALAKDRSMTYRRLFDSADGKQVLEDLSIQLMENDDVFTAGQKDVRDYLLGRRSVMHYLRNQIKRGT